MSLLPVVLGAVVAGIGGLFVPRLVGALPEPAPAQEGESAAVEKEPYVAIAASAGLAWKAGLAAAAAGALAGWGIGLAWPLATWLVLVPVAVALALVDWRTRLLPTRLIVPTYAALLVLVAAGSLLAGDPGDLLRAAAGSVGGYLFFFLLWFVHPRGLGFGDVRLSGVLGLALGQLGIGELLVGLYAGFLLGGLGGLLLRVVGVVGRREHIPFGPFMLVGALAGVLWGGPLWTSIYG